MKLINQAAAKRLIRENGKRCSADFLSALEAHVQKLVVKAAQHHNAGRKTVDLEVAAYVGINRGES